jgi:hypothetical protein
VKGRHAKVQRLEGHVQHLKESGKAKDGGRGPPTLLNEKPLLVLKLLGSRCRELLLIDRIVNFLVVTRRELDGIDLDSVNQRIPYRIDVQVGADVGC